MQLTPKELFKIKKMTAFLAIFFLIIMAGGVWALVSNIKERRLFDYDNPARRYCKRCGACQIEYGTTYNHASWWSEVYPLGNDKDCKCHKYAEYHD